MNAGRKVVDMVVGCWGGRGCRWSVQCRACRVCVCVGGCGKKIEMERGGGGWCFVWGMLLLFCCFLCWYAWCTWCSSSEWKGGWSGGGIVGVASGTQWGCWWRVLLQCCSASAVAKFVEHLFTCMLLLLQQLLHRERTLRSHQAQ